ncbi:hypothetical protein E5206_07250 [Arthrobacter sp. PAMC25564]|uniref:TadE/TadG family type IV pilus assembly protein n=1 Tax=Arthrobacter sp. PAMC25564 TaxID=2565366 RepID=UPI0010A29900|nr:TadE/TadG family type IV pilus assembly protein [Arthrobacter sp. PAMC25564]QCB96752.1 hypothetical protein E5206_07250 [Arthrobacter sp. PAMC25564]
MRRIGRDDPERGAIAPLAAFLMVALLGMAAFAVDVATMYSEHAQLQNGADSAALAIAQICGKDPANTQCTAPASAAKSYTDGNALDNSSNVSAITVDLGAGTVSVTAQARDTAGNNSFSLTFARALGIQTADIRASATAVFGGFGAANVVPLTFSHCESDPQFQKGLMFFPEHGSSMANQAGWTCTTPSSSGHEVPGGFGWLDQSGPCTVFVTLASPNVGSDTGNNFPSACDAKFAGWKTALQAGKPVEVLVPIFDNATGNGNNAQFHIEAFAQISIRGWQFNGGGTTFLLPDAQAKYTALGLKNSDTGLFGNFVRYVSLQEAGSVGGPKTYGAISIQLTK